MALFIRTKQNFKINRSVPQEENGYQIVGPAGVQRNISSEKIRIKLKGNHLHLESFFNKGVVLRNF